jgi:hypothetical protein
VRTRVTIVVMVAFVLLDLVLVTLAFRHTGPEPESASRDVDASNASRAATPSAGHAKGRRSAEQPPVYAFLDVGEDGRMLRASRGGCRGGDAAVVTVSTDAGKSSRNRRVRGLAEVLRVEVENEGPIWIIGRTTQCRVARWTSENSGRSWQQSVGAGGSWHLTPRTGERAVYAPDGRRETPCVPIGLSTVGVDVVRLLCRSGQVLATADSGQTWLTLGRLDGAVSIRYTSPAVGVALARAKGCASAVMETFDGGVDWSRQVCLEGKDPQVIGADGDFVAAQVGADLAVSRDRGDSWPGVTD